eukprot:Rmarinus@m.20060
MSRQHLQLLQADGRLCSPGNFLRHHRSTTYATVPCAIVAVIGCQGSGKSTLLNEMFGCTFPTLADGRVRRQTTQGIWVGVPFRSSEKSLMDVLLLDVEGTDSRERGEDARAFESKLSLFALSTADVLIVNLWFHDVGRYHASNYELLRIIFEERVKMDAANVPTSPRLPYTPSRSSQNGGSIHSGGRSNILVVLRDYDADPAELAGVREIIREDLSKLWKDASAQCATSPRESPEDVSSCPSFDERFHIHFVALPHYHYDRASFKHQVNDLAGRLLDPERDDFIFEKRVCVNSSESLSHGRQDRKTSTTIRTMWPAGIPPEEFSQYVVQLWQAINSTEQLNIPGVHQLRALYHCDLAETEAFKAFSSQCEFWQRQVERGHFVLDFGKEATDALASMCDMYDNDVCYYSATETYAKKRSRMLVRADNDLRKLFLAQVDIIKSRALKDFESQLKAEVAALPRLISATLPSTSPDGGADALKGAMEQFDAHVATLRAQSTAAYEERVAMLRAAGADWKATEPTRILQDGISEVVHFERAKLSHSLCPAVPDMRASLYDRFTDRGRWWAIFRDQVVPIILLLAASRLQTYMAQSRRIDGSRSIHAPRDPPSSPTPPPLSPPTGHAAAQKDHRGHAHAHAHAGLSQSASDGGDSAGRAPQDLHEPIRR